MKTLCTEIDPVILKIMRSHGDISGETYQAVMRERKRRKRCCGTSFSRCAAISTISAFIGGVAVLGRGGFINVQPNHLPMALADEIMMPQEEEIEMELTVGDGGGSTASAATRRRLAAEEKKEAARQRNIKMARDDVDNAKQELEKAERALKIHVQMCGEDGMKPICRTHPQTNRKKKNRLVAEVTLAKAILKSVENDLRRIVRLLPGRTNVNLV